MSDTLFAFFVSLVGGIFASYLTVWLEKMYQPVNSDYSKNGVLIYSHRFGVSFCSAAVFVAWLTIILLLVLIVASDFLSLHQTIIKNLFIVLSSIMLTCSLIFFGYGYFLKCDNCVKHILLQESETQKFAKTKWGLYGWALVVLNVLFTRKFQCMSCGQKYLLK